MIDSGIADDPECSANEAIRRAPWQVRRDDAPWPPSTHWLLLLSGTVLAAVTFLGVLSMPDLPFHPARDAELRASYDAYRATGVPLVKENGTGSWYGAVEGDGLVRAAGDDDPGTYLIAAWMSGVTGSESPYPGLRIVMALICALPLIILPLTVARVFRRARAGFAMLILPPVTWLVNEGTILVGTEYGLSDEVSPVRVYALYGMAASMLFLTLVVMTHLTTRRLRLGALLGVTLAVIGFAAACNLLRSMSGLGVAMAIGVIWWVNWNSRLRLVVTAGVVTASVVASMTLPGILMSRIDDSRVEVISPEASSLPPAHGTWHPLYLGLSYPQPITGQESVFGIPWSDEFGWAQAREIDPGVRIASPEYDAIMKDLFLEQVQAHPSAVVRLYLSKALYTFKHFAALILLVLIGFMLALRRPGRHRSAVAATVAVAAPTLAWGLVPSVLVMPMLYYYSELIAGLGLVSAIALGGLVWAYTTLPSFVRSHERLRLAEHLGEPSSLPALRELSVIVPSRNGAEILPDTLEVLGHELSENDEIIVVENGSTDQTADVLQGVLAAWPHPCTLRVMSSRPGLGNALRAGVLASVGRRVFFTADDLPFGLTDLETLRKLPDDVVVAIGSKAHPASRVNRSLTRSLQSRAFRWLRSSMLHSAVGDSQGTLWVDGAWARSFAAVSRESGLMWTVELVLAAEQQGLDVYEVPVTLRDAHDASASRFRLRDAYIGVREIWQLALRRDDYAWQDYPTVGRLMARPTDAKG